MGVESVLGQELTGVDADLAVVWDLHRLELEVPVAPFHEVPDHTLDLLVDHCLQRVLRHRVHLHQDRSQPALFARTVLPVERLPQRLLGDQASAHQHASERLACRVGGSVDDPSGAEDDESFAVTCGQIEASALLSHRHDLKEVRKTEFVQVPGQAHATAPGPLRCATTFAVTMAPRRDQRLSGVLTHTPLSPIDFMVQV